MVLAGRAIYGDEIQRLRQRIEAERLRAAATAASATMDIAGRVPRSASSATAKLARPMKIVVDSGNGIPGASAPGILRALGCEVDELYSEVDGDFPNHHPDPSKPENLADLIRAREEHRRRTRPRLRRRRRPPGRRHQGRPDHLPRPPADAVRAPTCCSRNPGAHGHLRRQVHAAPGAGDPRRRRRAADVEDRPFADQGQDGARSARRSPAR